MISCSEAIKSRLAGAIAAARIARKNGWTSDINTSAIHPNFKNSEAKQYDSLPDKYNDIALSKVYSKIYHDHPDDPERKKEVRKSTAKLTKRIPLDKIQTAQGTVGKEVLINK